MSLRGQLFSQNYLLKKLVMKSSVVMLMLQGANCTLAPSLSVIVTMALKPSSLHRGLMKFIVTDSKVYWVWARDARFRCSAFVVLAVIARGDIDIDKVASHVGLVEIIIECIV